MAKSNKISVPRHRKQSAASADRQERAIERRERQRAKKEIKEVRLTRELTEEEQRAED